MLESFKYSPVIAKIEMADADKELRNLDIPGVIETSDTDFAEDFYNPALSRAVEYKRGVGYFTSSWFRFAARGLQELAENGGTAKWIISPILEKEDWEVLKKGEKARRDQELYNDLKYMVSDIKDGLEQESKNTVAWMIADGLLKIKIAITDEPLSGDFHDKWGIIRDNNEHKIAFHGSQNDSQKAMSNYECYSIFTSWGPDKEVDKLRSHDDRFDRIWNNNGQGVHSFSLPDSIYFDIAELRDDDRPYQDPSERTKLTGAYRWRHQEKAVNSFLSEGSGILHMATGTGKTRTSLKILNRLLRQGNIENVVIATYGNDLLNQWYNVLLDHFNPANVLIYRHFSTNKQLGSFLLKCRDTVEALIISYDSLSKSIQGDQNNKLNDSLLICDEVHNMGSEKRRESLSGNLDVFAYTLGLSATPLDAYDEVRNEFLLDEVGSIVYKFDLDDAIRRGILCELEYTPLFYELSQEDKEEQQNAFARYQRMKKENPTLPKTRLYIMLARVRKESEQKLPIFEEHLEKDSSILEDCLIFVETMEYGKMVQKIIHDYTKRYRTYYGVDDERNLDDFSSGDISTLVTSQAISEGIDIKSVSNIVLFTSDRSKRTTIQRIGRALRTDPSNPDKTANIIDFVVRGDVKDNVDDEDQTPPDRDRYKWLQQLSSVRQEE